MRTARARVLLTAVTLLVLSACSRPGLNAGGEKCPDCGGVAWIAMSGLLIVTIAVLWFILGRDE